MKVTDLIQKVPKMKKKLLFYLIYEFLVLNEFYKIRACFKFQAKTELLM